MRLMLAFITYPSSCYPDSILAGVVHLGNYDPDDCCCCSRFTKLVALLKQFNRQANPGVSCVGLLESLSCRFCKPFCFDNPLSVSGPGGLCVGPIGPTAQIPRTPKSDPRVPAQIPRTFCPLLPLRLHPSHPSGPSPPHHPLSRSAGPPAGIRVAPIRSSNPRAPALTRAPPICSRGRPSGPQATHPICGPPAPIRMPPIRSRGPQL